MWNSHCFLPRIGHRLILVPSLGYCSPRAGRLVIHVRQHVGYGAGLYRTRRGASLRRPPPLRNLGTDAARCQSFPWHSRLGDTRAPSRDRALVRAGDSPTQAWPSAIAGGPRQAPCPTDRSPPGTCCGRRRWRFRTSRVGWSVGGVGRPTPRAVRSATTTPGLRTRRRCLPGR